MTAQSDPNTVQIPPPPVAPTGVSIVRTATNSGTLSWTDASTNETSFQPQGSNCLAPGANNLTCDTWGPWTNVGAAISRNPTQSAATGQVLTVSSPTLTVGNTTFARYQVLASNGTTSSTSASVILNNTVPPAAPSNVVVSCVSTSATQGTCTLNWVDNANNNVSWRLDRSSNANFTNVTQYTTQNSPALTANAVTFTTPPIPKGTYWFRIRAVNSNGSSSFVTASPAPVTVP